MTNKEWLEYLANNAPDELAAWFDAERTESSTSETMQHIGQVIENTIKRGVYGDTAAENADSRELLEADVYRAADEMDRFYCGEKFIDTRKIIGWLDRQAAITERETTKRHELFCETCEATTDKQVAELTAERDEWKSRLETGKAQFDAILAERELYREALSQLLDTVTDGMGKVSALLDNYDEGMA